MDVGKRIRELRESKGIEQLELAEKINISQSKMNKIETGFQKRLEPEILVTISKVLGTSVDYLVGNNIDVDEMTEDEIDEEIQEITKELNVWYKDEPEDKREKLIMLRKIIKTFTEDNWHHDQHHEFVCGV